MAIAGSLARPVLLILLAAGMLTARPAAAQIASTAPPISCVVGPFTNSMIVPTGVDAPAVYLHARTGLYRAVAGPTLNWTLLDATGRVSILAADPQDANRLLYSSGGTIYQSSDGGHSGTPLAKDPGISRVVRTDASNVLYASGSVKNHGAIFHTDDAGHTWSQVFDAGQGSYADDAYATTITALSVDRTDPAHAVALASGYYHGARMLETRDAGKGWHDLPAPAGTSLMAPDLLVMDPANGANLWAAYASWNGDRQHLLVHSHDGGQTWQRVTAGLPANATVTDLTIANPGGRVYLVVAGAATQLPNVVYMAPAGGSFAPLFPAGAAGIGQSLALAGAGTILLTWDDHVAPSAVRLLSNGAPGGAIPFHINAPAPSAASVSPVALLQGSNNDADLYALDPQSGAPLWQYPTIAPVAQLQVAGGTAYAASDGEDSPTSCIYAIDVPTGAARWSAPGYGLFAVDHAAVYALTDRTNRLVALDAATGQVRWQVSSGATATAPTIAGTMLYLAIPGSPPSRLLALDTRTGKQRWSVLLDGISGAPVQVADGTAYVDIEEGSVRFTLYALDAHTGAQRWRWSPAQSSGADTLVGIADGLVFVQAADRLIALDARTGVQRWAAQDGSAAPLIGGDTVYVPVPSAGASTVSQLAALNAATGAKEWTTPTVQAAVLSPFALADQLLLAQADGRLAAFDVRTGEARWQTPGPAAGSPRPSTSVSGATAYLSYIDGTTLNGTLYAVDLRSGQVLWHSSHGGDASALESPADTAPATLPTGALLVPATGHSVAAPFVSTYRALSQKLVIGLPLSEPYTEQRVLQQDFEHLRLERRGAAVVIGDLGVEQCALRCPPSARQSVPPVTTTPTRRYFAATGHTLQGALLTFWQKHGGLAVLGAPISEVFHATNGDGSGRSYQMQYFQHVRLELHPESTDPRYTVLFGRLGADFLQDRGWVTTR